MRVRLLHVAAVLTLATAPSAAQDPVPASDPTDASARASLMQAISRQLHPHWVPPQERGTDGLVTVLAWDLNEDGSLKDAPRVVRQTGINDTNRQYASLHAERAVRAVQQAAPFVLPKELYDKWKRISEWRFDRRT